MLSLSRLIEFCQKDLWKDDLTKLHGWAAARVAVLRVAAHACRSYTRNQAALRAAGLTMLTLMALVPFLAIVSGIAKGFGIQDALRAWAMEQVSRYTAEGGQAFQDQMTQLVRQIFAFIDNTSFTALNGISGLLLLYTVVSLLTTVENAFNAIWQVARGRSMLRRYSDYTGILMLVPVLMFAAIGLQTFKTLESVWPNPPAWIAWVYGQGFELLPLGLIWLAFTALYKLMPNTPVRWAAAAVGGFLGGSMWLLVQTLYIHFQIGVANANAIYGTFSALPLLLLYMYLSFLVLLIGAEISYGAQHVNAFRAAEVSPLESFVVKRNLAFAAVAGVFAAFRTAGVRWQPEQLAESAAVPQQWVDAVLEDLCRAGILVRAAEDEHYVPARAPERITGRDVVWAIMGHGHGPEPEARFLPEAVRKGLDSADQAMNEVLGSVRFVEPAAAS